MTRNAAVSIAGGGDFGVGPIAYLARLVADLRARGVSWDEVATQVVALFAGTSVGAILAAGLAIGMDPVELLGVFLHEVNGIFGERTTGGRLGLDPKYNDAYVNEALPRIFGQRTFAQTRTPLIVLAWDASRKDLRVFGPQDKDVPVWWAVRASMAAPTYFPPWGEYYAGQTVPSSGIRSLYDGGLGENDPTVDAIATMYDQALIPQGRRFRALELVTSGKTAPVPVPVPDANDITVAKGVVLPAITTGNSSRAYERARAWAYSLGDTLMRDVFRARPDLPDWEMDDLDRIPQIRAAWEAQYDRDKEALLDWLTC